MELVNGIHTRNSSCEVAAVPVRWQNCVNVMLKGVCCQCKLQVMVDPASVNINKYEYKHTFYILFICRLSLLRKQKPPCTFRTSPVFTAHAVD